MSVTIQTTGAGAFADLVKDLNNAAEILGRAEYRAINKVAAKAMTRSRREIVSQVNLTDSYVRERMTLTQARSDSPVAIISARVRPTTLSTYGAKVVTAPAPNAKGDARRLIPAGRKGVGVTVAVKKGGTRKLIRGAFVMPLKAGAVAANNGMGVFVRSGSRGEAQAKQAGLRTGKAGGGVVAGGLKHLYGPSVDQVFRGVISDIEKDVAADLEKTVADQTEFEVRKALKL